MPRQQTLDVERLFRDLGPDIGTFSITDIKPDADDNRLHFCRIRSSTYKTTYNVPEYETNMAVYYDREHELLGFFVRAFLEVPGSMYEWAINELNEHTAHNSMVFVQAAILLEEADEDDEDDEDILALECGYHLSTRQHVETAEEHNQLMTAMMRDAMNRLFTHTHALVDELGAIYENYMVASRH